MATSLTYTEAEKIKLLEIDLTDYATTVEVAADIEAALDDNTIVFGDSFTGAGTVEDPFEAVGGGTVDTVITDGSTNAVSGNAVFDALATLRGGFTGDMQDLYDLITAGYTTPAAPTDGVVDDVADTFGFTLTPTYVLSDHEYRINGGSWTTATANPIVVGDIGVAIGALEVRVKAGPSRNPSATLTNATAFTVEDGITTFDVPKFLARNQDEALAFTQSPGQFTTLMTGLEIICGNTVDTGGSTLLGVKSIEAAYDSTHINKNVGCCFLDTDQNYGGMKFTVNRGPNGDIRYYLDNATNIDSGYILPLAGTSKWRARAVQGTTYWEFYAETSTDSGATWTVRNVGGTPVVSTVPIATSLYCAVTVYESGTTVTGVKYSV